MSCRVTGVLLKLIFLKTGKKDEQELSSKLNFVESDDKDLYLIQFTWARNGVVSTFFG